MKGTWEFAGRQRTEYSMKNVVALIVILLCLGCQPAFEKEDLYGTWACENCPDAITMSFFDDSHCEIRIGNKMEKRYTGTFVTDFTKKPIPLSMTNISKLNHPIHTIIQFFSVNEFRMGTLSPRWRLRPIAFDPDTEMIFLRQGETKKSRGW